MVTRMHIMDQYPRFSTILIITNLMLLFYNVESSNKKGCDINCIKSCPREKEDVCGSDGLIYPNPCILKCCAEAEVDTSVCSENSMRRADIGTEIPTASPNNDKQSKKKSHRNRIPCQIDCYTSCSDDDKPVCGDNGKLFENVCKMDCCGIDETKMKFCIENGSKRAKITKVQNVEQWKQANAENDEHPNEQKSSISENTDAKKSTGNIKRHDNPQKENKKDRNNNMHTDSANERKREHDENKSDDQSKNKIKKKSTLTTKKRDDDQRNDKDLLRTTNNDKTRGNAALKKREKIHSKDQNKFSSEQEKREIKS